MQLWEFQQSHSEFCCISAEPLCDNSLDSKCGGRHFSRWDMRACPHAAGRDPELAGFYQAPELKAEEPLHCLGL